MTTKVYILRKKQKKVTKKDFFSKKYCLSTCLQLKVEKPYFTFVVSVNLCVL